MCMCVRTNSESIVFVCFCVFIYSSLCMFVHSVSILYDS